MKIMFQGDSITDSNRDRSSNKNLAGYSQQMKNILGDKYEYCNYACGGDTSPMMVIRHGYEFKKEMPDVLILLIGINDLWRKYDGHPWLIVPINKTIENVQKTIAASKRISPNCKIILLEPYLLPGPCMLFEQAKDDFPIMKKAFRDNLSTIVDKYIILDNVLNAEYKSGNVLSDDGVHPNEKGHRFLAEYIIKESKEIL